MRKVLLTLAIIYPALSAVAATQPYPSRPVTLIVPFGAGGPVDSVARILSDAMRTSLGQPVIIEHVSGVYFQNVTGTRFAFVPYRASSSEIMRDLVAGHIDFTFDQAITALPHVRNGSVWAYAVTSGKRLAAATDIPTVDEAGAPGVYISTWYGLWVPKGTPPEAIRKLTIAAMDALVDPTVRQRLTDLGQEIPPAEQQTAEALATHQKAEIEKWWPLIKAANIKAE